MLCRSPSRGEGSVTHSSGHRKRGVPDLGSQSTWYRGNFFHLSNEKAMYNIMHNDKGQISICSQV